MQDLLVPLHRLPEPVGPTHPFLIRSVFPAERNEAAAWVQDEFGSRWASEFQYAASLVPISAYIAIENGSLLGFACFDAAARGVFGPTGVSASGRGRGVGTALLLRALRDMRAIGYAYAVIGAAGPVEYYQRIVGAIPIDPEASGFMSSILTRRGD